LENRCYLGPDQRSLTFLFSESNLGIQVLHDSPFINAFESGVFFIEPEATSEGPQASPGRPFGEVKGQVEGSKRVETVAWIGLARLGSVWLDSARLGSALLGSARLDTRVELFHFMH
jgi:hypothetical protein